MKQKTIEKSVSINGVGLHSGLDSVLTLYPAEADTGIVFSRNGVDIPALYCHVVDTRNCTCLGKSDVPVSTIEHLMAALYVLGIDNIKIDCSNPELPIMDGSAKMFFDIFMIVSFYLLDDNTN